MDDEVAGVLADAFPDRDVDGLRPTGPSWNEANRTVGVEFTDGETVYLKVATDGDGSRVARERAVVEYVAANTSVPVPTVLASDPDGQPPYLVTAAMAGDPLLSPWSDADEAGRAGLARAVGRSLAAVHALRFEAHGHVTGGGADGLALDAKPWTDVLVDTIRRARARAPAERFDHHFDQVIAAVQANRDLLDDAPAALCHGDPAQPNCVVGDGGVGLLDWEIAHVGDPARDVYRARSQQFDPLRGDAPDAISSAFHDGYRERAGSLPDGYAERRPVYAAVRLLGTSGHFGKMAEFVDEPQADLAAWLDAEMERRLDALH